jgi:hypothetical protein
MRAIGSELEFMNMEAAMAKLLFNDKKVRGGPITTTGSTSHLCDLLRRSNEPKVYETIIEQAVVTTNTIGIIHSSRSFSKEQGG